MQFKEQIFIGDVQPNAELEYFSGCRTISYRIELKRDECQALRKKMEKSSNKIELFPPGDE